MIRPRWWAYAIRAVAVAAFAGMLAVLAWTVPTRTIASPAELVGTALFALTLLFVLVLLINTLPPYRLEVDAEGFRVRGLLYDRVFHWSEIERIDVRANHRLPGNHAFILVDGSHRPRRNWEQLGLKGYQIAPGNDLAGLELVRYLRRRHADWRKRQDGNFA